jgi:DNA polymerase III delta prime subunit
MKLSRVIEKIESYIKAKHPISKKFSHPEKLLEALRELDNMVEMSDAKKTISRHIRHIIVSKNPKNELLNTMIYGPPGVGKTEVGLILAKVWSSLGIIKKSTKPKANRKLDFKTQQMVNKIRLRFENTSAWFKWLRKNSKGDLLRKQNEYIKSMSENENAGIYLKYIVQDVLSKNYNRKVLGRDHHTISKTLGSLADKLLSSSQDQDNLTVVHDTLLHIEDTLKEEGLDCHEEEKEELPFIHAKPHDFIGQYIGETAIKSEEFLDRHEGKVIFVDEAYTMAEKHYGLEALTVITRAMTEQPVRHIFEFGGYKNLMRKINDIQPGLDSRCSIIIEIKGYSAEGLMKIFIQKLESHGKKIHSDHENDIKKHFSVNKDKYTHFGRDMQKLADACNIEYSCDAFDNLDKDDGLLTFDQFERGYKNLLANKPNDEIEAPKGMYS